MGNKRELLKDEITNEINNILNEMQNVDVNSKEYKELSLKKNLLDKELESLTNLDSHSFESFIAGIRGMRSQIISDVDNEDILFDILKAYKKYEEGLKKYKDFVMAKFFVNKEDVLDNEFEEGIYNLKTTRDFDILMEKTRTKEKQFSESKIRFDALTDNFDIIKYNHLKTVLESGTPLLYEELEDYKGMGADDLISKINSGVDEIMNKKFKTEKTKREDINKLIQSKLEILLKRIEDNVKKAYVINDHLLKIDVGEFKDFRDFYNSLSEKINNKNNNYKNIYSKTSMFRYLLEFNEKEFLLKLKKLGVELDNYKEDDKEDLFKETSESVENYVTKVRLSNRISRHEKTL